MITTQNQSKCKEDDRAVTPSFDRRNSVPLNSPIIPDNIG